MKIFELYSALINKKHKYNYKISEFDIRHLISFYQNIDPILSFYLKINDEVKHIQKIEKAFNKIKDFPIEYLLNETFFLKNKFFINKNVLIPRQETEELVDLFFKKINYFIQKYKKRNLNILDVGTGSGVIAIEIKKKFPEFNVYAVDISKKALKVAKKNASNLKVDVFFYYADTFPKRKNNDKKYDVVISNPPYIHDKTTVEKSVLKHEPHKALFITKTNNVYKKILKNVSYLSLPALVIFEISEDCVNLLNNLLFKYLKKYDYEYQYHKDMAKKIRFLVLIIKRQKC
ncbi:MAG: HemK family protein methyltransferase [Bacilli bacterium]|nr:HemK family protein methyltransferase [Bacilli bacterium]